MKTNFTVVMVDLREKLKEKTKTHPNTKFLPILQMLGTTKQSE